MTRIRCAWELNDLTVRMVRNMLLHNDVDSLLETGAGTPEEAALMVRCYELAAMELWDESALIEAATVAGMDDGFTLSGESPERIHRKITIAIKTKSAPEYMPPPHGVKLLYKLGVLVYDELEETVNRFNAVGRYDTTEPQQTAPAPDITAPVTVGPLVTSSDDPAQLTTAPATDTATPAPVMADSASNSTTPDPERRLARLRELGGNATYKRGEWKITGILALVASEKSQSRKRSDEKTIRADLKEAAENEREAKRANAFSGLGQR